MEFFLEMLFTAAVALFFSFLVAKLVSISMAGNGDRRNDLCSDQVTEKSQIALVDDFVTEEVSFPMKMDAHVLESERNFRVVDENVESVDRFGDEADRVRELQETATGNSENRSVREELVVLTAETVSTAAVPLEIVITEETIVSGKNEQSDSTEEIGAKRDELMVGTVEAESSASVLPENVVAEEIVCRGQEDQSESTELGRSSCIENEESEGTDVVVAEPEEVRIEESNTVEESDTKQEESEDKEEVRIEESNTVEDSHTEEEENEEKEELSIEEEDDWEGIERSELEIAFSDVAKYLEESGKAEEIGAEAKMELYGLHKIATEGSCREAQPMAVMISARARWNAWQKLGNMSHEEAMEQYLALVSKEIPGLVNTGHTVGKMPDIETSVVEPPNSGSSEDPNTLNTTGVDDSSKA